MRWPLVMSLLIACGSPEAAIDANDVDAAADAASDDAAADAPATDAAIDAGVVGPVKVTVSVGGQVAAGIPVVFQNADDSEVATIMTDAAGVAVASMAAGGSLSIVTPAAGPGFRYVTSYLGVEPGDELVYGDRDPQVRTLDVRLPAATGANVTYWVQMSCGGALNVGTSATVRVLAGCTSSDVYVSARESVNPYRDYGAFFVPDVALPPTGVLDFTSRSYAPAATITERLTNVPASIAFASTGVRVHAGRRDVWLGASSGASNATYTGSLSPTAMTTARVPAIGAVELLVESSIALRNSPTSVSPLRVLDLVAATTIYSLDLTTVTLPQVTSRPILDGAGRRATWSQAATGSAQWVWTYLRIRHAGQTFDSYDRDVIAPYQAGAVRIPRLPAAFAELNPIATDTATPLFLLLGTSPGGYRALRPVLETFNGQVGLLRSPGDRVTTSAMPTM